MNAADRLHNRFGFTVYRVPADSTEDFRALADQAAGVFREHALSWSLSRNRSNPQEWVELGPSFRERAARGRAAAALEDARILERLAAFEVDLTSLAEAGHQASPEREARVPERRAGLLVDRIVPVGDDDEDGEDGPVTAFTYQFWRDDYDIVFEVGGGSRAGFFDRDLPPIDPAEMTAAMRLAHSLARALASRLNAAMPAPFRVTAEQERVYLIDDRGMTTGGSIVDLGIEAGVTRVLQDVQDDMTEALTAPWPDDPARGYTFHEPGIAIRDGAVHFWYGNERNPVLAFDPIPLSELQS